MVLEKLGRRDLRLIAICAVVSAISLFVGARYFFRAFPEASIEFRYTRGGSTSLAASFLEKMDLDPAGYRHAAVFGYDDQAKTFLERELGVEEANRLLETTVRLWRWQHRWFRPLQKEEIDVEVTTRGEVVGFAHLLPEDAEGADLSQDDARAIAESFLAETMGRPLAVLSYVEGSTQKRPNRADHAFTWKLLGSEVEGADYRIEVSVAGERIARYSEHLKVPDTWIRDYAKLRSRNEITGQVDGVLLFLTLLAMLVVLVLRVRRSDVRWRPAVLLGGLIFVLLTLSQLNTLPSALYAYDTTQSYGAFLLGRIFSALLAGLGAGALIFVLSASAEPLYRERLPAMLSLTSLLRLRALRTREFFIASLVGVTLTFFFFAYENVFYIIANAMGAWAPREVLYSELLSTAFPWVYVLFFGFLPAISEEFISRMFSIPFLEKFLRSAFAAVVVSAFIWGFGHAAYPNQPFWIRGLEVGLAGLAFGWVFLRFGIAAAVICHFSVDALYTAFVLIRSPNPYYVISGSLSAGVFALLLLGAGAAYLWRGGFLPAVKTNAEEGTAPPLPPTAAAGTLAPGPSSYTPIGRRVVAASLVLAAALAAIALVPAERFGDWLSFAAGRSEAHDAGREFLANRGFDVSSYRSAIVPLDRTDPAAGAYLREYGAAGRVYEDLVPTPLWIVRFFVPGQHEEFRASVDPRNGSVIGFSRTLPEDAAGASLPPEEALALAEGFLRAQGIDPAAGELKEQTAKDEKARRDHTLVWELPIESAGEARVRQEVIVQGDAVGSWGRAVKIPEEWERDWNEQTAVTTVLRYLKIPFLIVLAGFALGVLILKIRAGAVPWRGALVGGAVVAVALALRVALTRDAFWSAYDTSIPAGGWVVVILIGIFLSAVFAGVTATALVALAGAAFPHAVNPFRRDLLGARARDALIAGAVALAAALGVPALLALVGGAFPAGRVIAGVPLPGGVAASLPFVGLLCAAVTTAIMASAAGGGLVALWRGPFRSTAVRVVLAVLFLVSFFPSAAREPSQYLAGAVSLGVSLLAVALLVRFVLRDNPLAWLCAAFFASAGSAGFRLLDQPAYRVQGILTLCVVGLIAVGLALAAVRGRSRELSREVSG